MMKRSLLVLATVPAMLVTPGHAAPATMTLTGTATMEIHERTVYADPYALETSIVETTLDVNGVSAGGSTANGFGTATLVEEDRTTVVYVSGSMHPPLGSGGEAHLSGLDADGNLYCFGIYDYSDAPSPRPDRTIAAFTVASTYLSEYAAAAAAAAASQPGILLPSDLCYDLLYKHAWVLDGDFTIALSD